MEDRRSFLKKVSVTGIGFFLTSDPFINALAKMIGENPLSYAKKFSHICDYTRDSDLLNMRFYFVNFALYKNTLYNPSNDNQKTKAYVIIRIPQQHIPEEFKTTTEFENLEEKTVKAFISGYSYLTFQIEKDRFSYTHKELLDWSKFNLVTMEDIENLPALEGGTLTNYPQNVLDNDDRGFFFNAGQIKIPVTIFEAPYKLFLSPVAPVLRGKRNRVDIGYVFENPTNNEITYYFDNSGKRILHLVEPWNNTLIYKIIYPEKTVIFPPSFKAVAYQKKNMDGSDTKLAPSENDRKDIVEHSLLDFETSSRDINSDFFNIGALGVTTNLSYKNYFPKKTSSFVEWDQKIKNGRDNYIKITKIGVDIRSGKKVLVSEITERLIHDGKSLLVQRLFLSFLEEEKEYMASDFPYKRSVLKDKGFYFRFVPLSSSNPSSLKVSDSFGGVFPAFIPVEEDTPVKDSRSLNDAEVKKKIIKLEFAKSDKQENEKRFSSHLAVIFSEDFAVPGRVEQYLDNHKALTGIKGLGEYLWEETLNEKLAFVPPEIKDVGAVNKNTSLITQYFQFESRKNGDFTSASPITQHLIYAKVTPPQLEGFNGENAQHFEYSIYFKGREIINDLNTKITDFRKLRNSYSYFNNGEKINVNTEDLNKIAESYAKKLDTAYDLYKSNRVFFNSIDSKVETTLTGSAKDAKGIFTQNLNKIGSIINPDIVISGLSELDQALTLSQHTELKINPLSKEVKIRSEDFLRGVNAEIFNGISIKNILKEIIPIDQTPIFEVIDKAEQGIRLYAEYSKKYDDLVNLVNQLPKEIEENYKKLYDTKRTEVEAYFDKWIETQKRKIELDMLALVVSPIEKKVKLYLEKYASAANELKDLNKSKTVAEIRAALNNLKEKDETYIIAAWSKVTNKGIIQYIINIPEVIAEENYKPIIRIAQLIIESDKTLLKKIDKYIVTNTVNDLGIDISSRKDQVKAAFETIKNKEDNYIIAALVKQLVDGQIRRSINAVTNTFNKTEKVTYSKILGWLEHLDIEMRNTDLLYADINVLETQLKKEIKEFIDEKAKDKYELYKKKFEYFQKVEYGKRLQHEYESIKDIAIGEINTELDKFNEVLNESLKKIVDGTHITDFRGQLAQYNLIQNEIASSLEEFSSAVAMFDNLRMSRKAIEVKIKELTLQLDTTKREIKNFIQLCIEDAKNQLEVAGKELKDAYDKGKAQVDDAIDKLEKAKLKVKKLLESNEKFFKYTWEIGPDNFSNFKGPFVSFLKTPTTSFKAYSSTKIKYELSLEAPPKYKGIEVYSYNTLRDFKIGFFDIILIDFAEVSFKSGTKIDSDLKVNINNIYFSGALTFISAFQQALQAFKFIKSILDGGVLIDYKVPVKDIAAGGFNFVNIKLYTAIFLPIGNQNLPIRFDFGFNSPEDMFLVTYGIFGGRGCFQIGLTPKQGVVSILLVIEFGGVIYLNIGVAKGIAYLFAGFYFRKQNNIVSIRAYLTAGGAFRIAGLITASITFYMGLEGNGHILKGRCYIQYSFKIGFIEFSFLLPFEKQIAGASVSQNKSEQERSELIAKDKQYPLIESTEVAINLKTFIRFYLIFF